MSWRTASCLPVRELVGSGWPVYSSSVDSANWRHLLHVQGHQLVKNRFPANECILVTRLPGRLLQPLGMQGLLNHALWPSAMGLFGSAVSIL